MKVLVIAQNTYREACRQPICILLLLVFGASILLSPWLTLFTLRDASGVIREMGVASVTICCLLVALFSASNCVWQEIERRTALTVLSKPVRREEFLLGKFLGIYWTVLYSALFLTTLLTLTVWWHEGVKLIEAPVPRTSRGDYFWFVYIPQVKQVAVQKLPVILGGVALSLVQLSIITAVSVAVSVVCPTVLNVCLCVGIYLLGNLTNYIQELTHSASAWVRIPAELVWVVVPNFENLNASWSVTSGQAVSPLYMLSAMGYGAIYTAAALLIGLAIFSERELL